MTLPSVPALDLFVLPRPRIAAVSRGVLLLLVPLLVAAGAPLAAQREPVLKQIALPHNYYFREMYLPQATSGPSAVTWLPDGRTLVFSMQGSLWRQRIGEPVAEQLTTGPGYAYQPDAAPDGGRMSPTVYVDDQVELRVLDLQTLTSTVLVRTAR